MKKTILVIQFVLICIFAFGCQRPQKIKPVPLKPVYDAPLPPGADALIKLTNPHDIPEMTFACYNLTDAKQAAARSLNYLNKPSSKQFFPISSITHEKALVSMKAFIKLLDSGLYGQKLNAAILDKFDVYMSVGCDNRGTVLFTGYYTPIFNGSNKPTARFKYPLYKQPDDLVKRPNGEILGRKLIDGSIDPYPTRKNIERLNLLEGNELLWMEDPFEVYIVHVQGSAKIRLPDGTFRGVGYAANNGREYRSISKQMVASGSIPLEKMSLAAMIEYFKAHKDEVQSITAKNPRFVFFKDAPGDPRGSLNEEVTANRSIATDKSIFPRGSLTFISTRLPRETNGVISEKPYTGFTFDQDTGGAIRAPGRCDIYMGTGQEAGNLAGRVYQEGKLYYLFVK